MSEELRQNYDLGVLAGVAQERKRIQAIFIGEDSVCMDYAYSKCFSLPDMREHSNHCNDPFCYSCDCTPECDYWPDEPNVMVERNRIIDLIDGFIENCDLPEIIDRFEWLKKSIRGEINE